MAINLRSPYYTSTSAVGTAYTELDISIWAGDKDDTITAQYSLRKNVIGTSEDVLFEISELVRDYLDTTFDGDYNGQAVWVKTIKTAYDSSDAVIGNPVESTVIAFDGYSYFEDNQKYTPSLFVSNREIFSLDDNLFRVPINTYANPLVTFYNDGEVVASETLYSSIKSNEQVKYVSIYGYSINYDTYFERVLETEGTYEGGSCIESFLDSHSIDNVDKITVSADYYGNELIPSVDIDNDWFANGTLVTPGQSSPIDVYSAYNVSSTTTGVVTYVSTDGIAGVIEGNEVEISVYLKSDTAGSAEIRFQELLGDYTNYFSKIITLTNTWTEYKVSGIKLVDGNLPRMLILSNGTNPLDVDVWHPSVKESYGNLTDTIKVNTLNECKYEPKKVTFINKFGALQDMYFFKKAVEQMTIKKESYKSNIISSLGTYNSYNHVNRDFNVVGSESITLSSGYLSEEYNEVFKQLLLSEKVWVTNILETGEQVLPINVKTSSIKYKTSVNDKLVDYTIEFDKSFDTINNIR